MPSNDVSSLESLLRKQVSPAAEREGLARLMTLLAGRGVPPDSFGLYPRYGELLEAFLAAAAGKEGEALEESFLALYAHLHGYEVPATAEERRRLDAEIAQILGPLGKGQVHVQGQGGFRPGTGGGP